MNFLKELKEDLAQALDELIPEETAEESMEPGGYDDEEIVNTLEPEAGSVADDDVYDLTGGEGNVDAEFLRQIAAEEEATGMAAKESFGAYGAGQPDAAEEPNPGYGAAAPELSREAKNDVTVISKGTIINGSLTSDGSVEVAGTINGDVECLGKLIISGKVNGSSTASEVYVNNTRLDGGIMSEGSVKIGIGTVMVGDIIASSSVIAGTIKGQIDVNGPVVVDSTAVIKGNINAKAVQINNGAVIEGFCSLSYASVDIDSFFEE